MAAKPLVIYEGSVAPPKMTSVMRDKIAELREVFKARGIPAPSVPPEVAGPLFEDDSLHRFLRARNGDVPKAEKMLLKTLEWRLAERPDLLRSKDFSPNEMATGKIRIGGHDRWGRPILILDNTVENTTDVDTHMRLLFWTTERLIRLMKPPVEKHLLFVHLPDFSLFNTPPLRSTKMSLAVFSLYYAERLGHCVAWQPPSYFATFIAMIRPFLDPATYAKVTLINGDTSPGSPNDLTLVELIGPDWREKTGAGGKRETPKSSPGYVHKLFWQRALDEEEDMFRASSVPTDPSSHYPQSAENTLEPSDISRKKEENNFFRAVKVGDHNKVSEFSASAKALTVSTVTTYDGWSALHIAAQEGHVRMVSLLLTLGCDCDAKNNHGDTPIMRAATAGHIPVVSELVASNASIDKTNNAGYTALVLATIYNRPGVVNFLLSAKANCELRDKDNYTALLRAAQFGHVDCITALRNGGANILVTRDGQSARDIAECQGYSELMMYLV